MEIKKRSTTYVVMTVSAALWHDSKWTDNKYQLAPLWCLSYAKAFSGWGEARGSRLTSVQLALCLRENGTRRCGVNELQWRKWNCQLFLWSDFVWFDSRLGRLSGTMTVVNSSHQSPPPFLRSFRGGGSLLAQIQFPSNILSVLKYWKKSLWGKILQF